MTFGSNGLLPPHLLAAIELLMDMGSSDRYALCELLGIIKVQLWGWHLALTDRCWLLPVMIRLQSFGIQELVKDWIS